MEFSYTGKHDPGGPEAVPSLPSSTEQGKKESIAKGSWVDKDKERSLNSYCHRQN